MPETRHPLPAPFGRLFAEWRRLTESEGASIQAAAWDEVLQVQETKKRLQSEILDAEHGSAPWTAADQEARRALVSELILLELRNMDWLGHQRAAAEVERASVEKSRLDLRRLQRTFSPQPSGVWQSYS
jgi:tyrosyl-tRNA synthetase